MIDVLPPEAGLEIQGIFHQYTINKQTNANAKVLIENRYKNSNENVYERTDNWDQLPSNTKIGFDRITPSQANLWGRGSIRVEGDATLSDVTIAYNYRYDPCYIPSDPTCENFYEWFYKFLSDNNLLNETPDPSNKYYDEWLKLQEDQKPIELVKEEVIEKEPEETEEKEFKIEQALAVVKNMKAIADPQKQLEIIKQFMQVGRLDNYTSKEFKDSIIFKEKHVLKDNVMHDNYRAFNSFAVDKKHDQIIRSQYKDLQ